MKDVAEVLRSKELELSRVRQEVEALGIVAPLLHEAEAAEPPPKKIPSSSNSGHVSVVDLIKPTRSSADRR